MVWAYRLVKTQHLVDSLFGQSTSFDKCSEEKLELYCEFKHFPSTNSIDFSLPIQIWWIEMFYHNQLIDESHLNKLISDGPFNKLLGKPVEIGKLNRFALANITHNITHLWTHRDRDRGREREREEKKWNRSNYYCITFYCTPEENQEATSPDIDLFVAQIAFLFVYPAAIEIKASILCITLITTQTFSACIWALSIRCFSEAKSSTTR